MSSEILSLIDETFVFPPCDYENSERYPKLEVNFDYLEDLEQLKRFIKTSLDIQDDDDYEDWDVDEKKIDDMINEALRRNNFIAAEFLFRGREDQDSDYGEHLRVAVRHSNLTTFVYAMLALVKKYTHEYYEGIDSKEFLKLAFENPNPGILELAEYIVKFYDQYQKEGEDYDPEDGELKFFIEKPYIDDDFDSKFTEYIRPYFSGQLTKSVK